MTICAIWQLNREAAFSPGFRRHKLPPGARTRIRSLPGWLSLQLKARSGEKPDKKGISITEERLTKGFLFHWLVVASRLSESSWLTCGSHILFIPEVHFSYYHLNNFILYPYQSSFHCNYNQFPMHLWNSHQFFPKIQLHVYGVLKVFPDPKVCFSTNDCKK